LMKAGYIQAVAVKHRHRDGDQVSFYLQNLVIVLLLFSPEFAPGVLLRWRLPVPRPGKRSLIRAARLACGLDSEYPLGSSCFWVGAGVGFTTILRPDWG
jgi:hypothetical protein